MGNVFISIKKKIKKEATKIRIRKSQKIFCIGRNKTGTTSLAQALKELGFRAGNQTKAEMLFDDWVKRDFHRLIAYCKTAEFFQDIPFSLPYTFCALDHAFPKSKFILTIRSPEEWYNSVIQFSGKIHGNGKIPPTAADLKNSNYMYKGYAYHVHHKVHLVTDDDIYNKNILISDYIKHNELIIDYFRHRPDDLLILNISEKDSYQKLCDFLNLKNCKNEFPWENKTSDVQLNLSESK